MFDSITMSIPVRTDGNQLPLMIEEVIASHWGLESLNDENDRCDRCHQYRTRLKKTTVVRWPQVLVLHLKRWEVVQIRPVFRRKKVDAKVSFDTVLDVEGGSGHYDLRGIVNHEGQAGGGHYTAHVRAHDNKWYFCDDRAGAVPRNVPVATALASQAYLLVYERA